VKKVSFYNHQLKDMRGSGVFGYILFDLVLFDIRYWQQFSDKYGQYTGNANWKRKGRRED
jgi:hypothetical protein